MTSPRSETRSWPRSDLVSPAKTPKRLILDLEDSAAELIGCTLSGRYVVESVLGQGGMGTVYRARHSVIGRTCAIKVLRREIAGDAESVQRFIREAKIAGGLSHPNIAEVIDFGEVTAAELPSLGRSTQPFMVMPELEGQTLAEILERSGPLDGWRVARLFAQAADALAAAHDKAVIHRDLKPDNLFVTRDRNGAELVKVLDFGVAKLLTAPKLTRKGTVFGTPYYMSPEQASDRGVDHFTDQYALGVVMYEVLSGRVPFDDDSPMGVMKQHLFATPEPLEEVVPDVTRLGEVGPVVMRCLAKAPNDRFPNMRALAAALNEVARKPAQATPRPAAAQGTPRPAALLGEGPRGTVRMPSGATPQLLLSPSQLQSAPVAPVAPVAVPRRSLWGPLLVGASLLLVVAGLVGWFLLQRG
jgi:serine/threonine-protein kinase